MSAKGIKQKLADLAERVVCGSDDGQDADDELREAQEDDEKS